MTLTRFEFTRRARPLLEIGLGSTEIGLGAGLWDVSLWDAAGSTWNGDEPLWRDFSCDGIDAHIELGRGRITDSFPVGTATVTVDNSTGWADPSIDFDIDSEPGYFSFPGTAGNFISVDDYAALGITGDICIVTRIRTAVWPPPEQMIIAGQTDAWGLVQTLAETLVLLTVQGGVLHGDGGTALTPTTDWRWFAFVLDVNNGAGGHDWKIWYGGSDTSDPAWVEFASDTDAGVRSIDNVTNPLTIGGNELLNANQLDISHLSIRSGFGPGLTVGGTTVFEFNGWTLGDHDVGSTSIMPSVGPNPMIVTGDVTVTAAMNPAGDTLLEMRPGRPIRIGVEHDTFGKRWRFNGFIDEILPSDAPDDWSTVTLKCIDALGEAGRAKLATDVETGAGELAHARFTRVLNAITWPQTKRAVSTSAIRPLYATEIDGQVVDLLRQTAESDGGWCFGDDQGNVVLKNRDWLYHVGSDSADAVIGNFGGVFIELLMESGDDLLVEQLDEMLLEDTEDEVCPGRWLRSFARSDITTRVILDRDLPADTDPIPAPVVFNDLPSQVLYGIEPFERLDLWTLNTGDLQQIAGRILAGRQAKVSMPRVSAVTVDATTSPLAVDLLASLSIFTPSRYQARLQTARGTVFDANFFAVGVTEDISADGWTAEIALDRSSPFGLLQDVDYVWDTGRWDRSLWN